MNLILGKRSSSLRDKYYVHASVQVGCGYGKGVGALPGTHCAAKGSLFSKLSSALALLTRPAALSLSFPTRTPFLEPWNHLQLPRHTRLCLALVPLCTLLAPPDLPFLAARQTPAYLWQPPQLKQPFLPEAS